MFKKIKKIIRNFVECGERERVSSQLTNELLKCMRRDGPRANFSLSWFDGDNGYCLVNKTIPPKTLIRSEQWQDVLYGVMTLPKFEEEDKAVLREKYFDCNVGKNTVGLANFFSSHGFAIRHVLVSRSDFFDKEILDAAGEHFESVLVPSIADMYPNEKEKLMYLSEVKNRWESLLQSKQLQTMFSNEEPVTKRANKRKAL